MDLVGVTEKLASYVKVPDAGLVGGTPESSVAQLHGYRDPGSASGMFGSVDGGLNLGTSRSRWAITFLNRSPSRILRSDLC